MPTYSLTVANQSELPSPTFALFAVLPNAAKAEVLHLAWLTRQVNANNQCTFGWDMDWAFTWSAQGTRRSSAGSYTWQGGGSLEANPETPDKCQAVFSYNGDFQLEHGVRAPVGDTLWLHDDGTVPRPSVQLSSVGISLNGSPVCAVEAGPSLDQTFTVHPTYYIDAGTYQQGQMIDVSTVTTFQEIRFENGATAQTVKLSSDNGWSVGV
jgi:hypothetical protein